MQAGQATDLQIVGGDWLVHQPAIANTDWTTEGKDLFTFCKGQGTVFDRNWMSPGNGQPMKFNAYIHIYGGACGEKPGYGGNHDFRITNNHFEYGFGSTYEHLIIKGPGTTGVLVRDNTFSDSFSPQLNPPLKAFNWTNDAASAIYFGPPGQLVGVTSSAMPATSGVELAAGTATLPPGVWTCSARLDFGPTSGAVITTARGLISTNPVNPAKPPFRSNEELFFQYIGTANIRGADSRPMGPVTFDFTTKTENTNVYFIGRADFSSGAVSMNSAGQCARVR